MRDVVVIFGLSGSGKSFLSKILHEELGYEWIRSDVLRKEMMGLDPQEKAKAGFGEGIYKEEITKKVYEEMIRRAKELLSEGKKVVLDATFLKRWQRDLVREAFENPLFVLATASEKEIERRLSTREDVSDADFSVYLRQKEVFEPPEEVPHLTLSTEKGKEELLSVLKELVED